MLGPPPLPLPPPPPPPPPPGSRLLAMLVEEVNLEERVLTEDLRASVLVGIDAGTNWDTVPVNGWMGEIKEVREI